MIYQANIDCDIAGYKQKCYLDLRETTFKDRFENHKKSFNQLKHKNETEQSKEFIKPTLTVTSLDINKNVTLAHVKQHLKIVSGIIKSRSTTLNIKMIKT